MKNKNLLKRVSLVAMLFISVAFTNKMTAQYVQMTFHNGSIKSIFFRDSWRDESQFKSNV